MTGVTVSLELVNKRWIEGSQTFENKPIHRRNSLLCAQERQKWDRRKWRRIIWSNEFRYNLYVADDRIRVRCLLNIECLPQNIFPTVVVQCWGWQLSPMASGYHVGKYEKYGHGIIQSTMMPFIHPIPHIQNDNARLYRFLMVTELKQYL